MATAECKVLLFVFLFRRLQDNPLRPERVRKRKLGGVLDHVTCSPWVEVHLVILRNDVSQMPLPLL